MYDFYVQLNLSRLKSIKVYSNIRRLLPSLDHGHYLQKKIYIH